MMPRLSQSASSRMLWVALVAVIVSVLAGFMVGSGLSAVAMFISVLVADAIWNAR